MRGYRVGRMGRLLPIGLLLCAALVAIGLFRLWGPPGGAAGLALLLVLAVWLAMQRRRSGLLAALEHCRRQLHETQRLARIGSWELDHAAGRLDWSASLYEIFAIDPQLEASYERFIACVHAEDRGLVESAYQNALENQQPYEIEHRIELPDGSIRHIRERGETIYADDGRPLRTIGTAQDITDIRRLEAQMTLLGTAFQHSGEAILISDPDNRIIAVNPAFTKLTGYSQEDVIGRNPKLLSSGRNTPDDYRRMWQAIRQDGFWQGEMWDRNKDGAVFSKWLSISVIADEGGGVRYYVAHFTEISSERASEARLHHLAHHDMLTGLLNRYSLQDRLEHSLAVARRNAGRVALLFLDLDRFKTINDTLGHQVGDQLLIDVSQRLLACVRESDVVARLGGDEFIVMLSGLEHSGSAAMIAEKIVHSIDEPYAIGPHTVTTSPSIGIAIYPMDGQDSETLMKNADAAMYCAKRAGRNNFQFFDARMNQSAQDRLGVEHALRVALGRDEFRLYFQPVIELASGRVHSVEALVRWQHPERGLLTPGAFLGVAEETGLIQPLGDWVFWNACRQLAALRAAGINDVGMSINISAIQLRNGDLNLLVQGGMAAYALQPGDLLLEIRESTLMAQADESLRILDLLHAQGIRLALDDFGTGFSSLAYLRLFPLEQLKLDRSLIDAIDEETDGELLCDAGIGLAATLGLQAVAEGVESEAQLAHLRERGCPLAQGYLFSPPLPFEQLIAFIRQRNH